MAGHGRLAVPRGGRVCCGASIRIKKKMSGGNVPLLLQKGHGWGMPKPVKTETLSKISLRPVKQRYISI